MLKFIKGSRIGETSKFNAYDAPIIIGRSFDCHLSVQSDESLSRYHCRIDNISKQWVISDGYGDYKSPNTLTVEENKEK